MMIGIPSLADINLSYGRDFGNQLLCDIANAFEEMELIEESYHTEQNNFALIISECDEKKVESIYDRVSLAMNGKASVCAGVVPIDKSVFMDVSQIIDSANVTLSGALQNMMGQILFFSSDDIGKRINEIKLLEELKESVQNGFEGFDVFYQPQIKRGNYQLYGIEALLRYNSKERGRVFPDEFIPIREGSGLIDPA
jgi:predicted signal transduction protein with EAL and GGDEF domain